MRFYLLSLKHSHPDSRVLVWWKPAGLGYVESLKDAGWYWREEIDGNPSRFNDGVNVIAVPCPAADAVARKNGTVSSRSLRKMKAASHACFVKAPAPAPEVM